MALASRNPQAGLLYHSDRGSPYAATRYQLLLTTHGITTSMSRNGNCWDNAWVERFFGTLKREHVSPRHDATRAGIQPLAIIPRPSTKRGRPWRHHVSTEMGKGQKRAFWIRWHNERFASVTYNCLSVLALVWKEATDEMP